MREDAFLVRVISHIKRYGIKSFIKEGSRRICSIFYVNNCLILHEKRSFDIIPDWINKYNLKLTMKMIRKEDTKEVSFLKNNVRVAEKTIIDDRLSKGKKLFAAFNENGDLTSYIWVSDRNEYIKDLNTIIDSTYIFDGVTINKYRGKGFMVGLVQKTFELFKEQGISNVLILTLPDNKSIIKVSSRFGFVPIKKMQFKRILFFSSYKEELIDNP